MNIVDVAVPSKNLTGRRKRAQIHRLGIRIHPLGSEIDRTRRQGAVYIEPNFTVVKDRRDEMPVTCETTKIERCAPNIIIIVSSNTKEESIRFLVPS